MGWNSEIQLWIQFRNWCWMVHLNMDRKNWHLAYRIRRSVLNLAIRISPTRSLSPLNFCTYSQIKELSLFDFGLRWFKQAVKIRIRLFTTLGRWDRIWSSKARIHVTTITNSSRNHVKDLQCPNEFIFYWHQPWWSYLLPALLLRKTISIMPLAVFLRRSIRTL